MKTNIFPNGKIADGIYSASQWCDDRLVRIFVGSKECGPMMQYEAGPEDQYNGFDYVSFPGGAWTNCYSRGNYGGNYACGGNWSGHTKNLYPRLAQSKIENKTTELLVIGEDIIDLPDGIRGDVKKTEIDCSGSWSIFYARASVALSERLSCEEISISSLPQISKDFLCKTQTQEIIDRLADALKYYEL